MSLLGLHAILPLLIFWIVAACAWHSPCRSISLPGGSSASPGQSATTASWPEEVWALACGLGLLSVMIPLLAWLGMSPRALLVQHICGAAVCALIVDGLMFANSGIPFAQPRSPGITSLPLMLTLFIGVLPIFVLGTVRLEIWLESRLFFLVFAPVLLGVVHQLASALPHRWQPQIEDGDEIVGNFELLRLGVD